jgi:hypothetical protein
MKSIEIIEKDGALIIKKRLEAWFLIFLIAATVALPILAHRYLGDVIAVIDAVFMLMWTVSYAARPHLDRIIIDKSARMISFGKLFGNKQYRFDELSDIYYWAVERNDPENEDIFRVIFQFKDGRKRFLKTDSKKQMQELIDTVKSIVGLN